MNLTLIEFILQHHHIAYALTDRDLKITQIEGDLQLLHSTNESCMGWSLLDIAPELIGTELQIAAIFNGEEEWLEVPVVQRDFGMQGRGYVNLSVTALKDDTDTIIGLLYFVENITDIGRMEQRLTQQRNELSLLQTRLERQNTALEAANAELKELDNLKSKFVSIAAHELRTPLSSISGFVEMLLDGDFGQLTTDQQKYLGIVQRSSIRLLNITNSLLDITQIATGRIELIMQPTDILGLMETIATDFQPMLDEKGQVLMLDAAPNVSYALCDPVRATQILTNLVSNASKYTPAEGQIQIRLGQAEEEGFLQIAVADNGIGIPEADQPRLFDTFFRAGNVTEVDANGAGLGLNITASLVELHGGKIWFDSVVNQGTTFYVTLPVDS